MKVLKSILQFKYLYICVFVIVFVFSFLRISVFKGESEYQENENYFILKVVSLKKNNQRYIVELEGKEKLISYCDTFPYDVGDILKVKGNLEKIEKNTIFNSFDFQNYYESKDIFYTLKIEKMVLEKKNNSLLNKLRIKIRKRIESQDNKEFLFAFIVGDTSYLEKDVYAYNGISSLLSIGFFQILTISFILEKVKRKLKIKEKYFLWIMGFVLFGYMWLVSFKIGIVRSGMCYLIKRIMKYKKIKMKYSNIILLVGSILILIRPSFLHNIGFYYSFVISYGLSLVKKIKGNYFKRMFFISLYANLFSLPLNIFFNYEVNFLSIISSIIFALLIHFIIFPLCILVFFFSLFSQLLNFFICLFYDLNLLLNEIQILHFVLKKPNIIIIVLYYCFIILFVKKKKYFILVLLLFFLHLNVNNIIFEKIVTFLDVGQGDSVLIKLNNTITLIDTGGSAYKEYSNDITKYIYSLGMDKISNLIITHGDFDHMGEAINLVNNIKVEKVIFNCGEYNDLEKDLIKVLDKKHIKYYSCIKELNIDKDKLYFLETKEYDNENDNSNVIYTELDEYKFMFMGDAGVTTEKEILNKYKLPDIDILKVGHHGSKTSSGKEFINEINPKYSIISVGKNNRYGHPNKEVLENLKTSKIYRTDEDGSIMFKIKNNKLEIQTCSP